MNWITQNWLWMLLALAVLVALGRGASRGRRGYGHHGNMGGSPARGFEHGGHGRSTGDLPAQDIAPASAIDPVTRKDVSTNRALTSIYQGRIYYFETVETRERFEAAPGQYARQELGHPVSPTRDASARHYGHRGC